MRKYSVKIDIKYNGYTVYKYLREVLFFSNKLIKRIKRIENSILLNGKSVFVNVILKTNDLLEVFLKDEKFDFITYDKFVEIIYEDEDCLVYNKPPFLPTHQSLKNYDKTLANVFFKFCEGNNKNLLFRPVNRLDKNTSGLIMVAKNSHMANYLSKNIKKYYFFLVKGILKNKKGILDFKIDREKESIINRCVCEDGQIAVTHYEVINEYNNISLIKAFLETGRTHQIRVHFAYINHPVIGDDLYGKTSNIIDRQALHCGQMSFKNFNNNKIIDLNIDLFSDIKKAIKINLNEGKI